MNNKKVGIVGHGYVGKAFERYFQDNFEVIWYDPFQEGGATEEQINDCDLAVVCVPTNMNPDGSCDTSIVEDVMSWLDTPLIIIKSAVKPGTVDSFKRDNICVSPEYVGEGKYFVPQWKYPHPTDIKSHDFFVIGGKEPARSKIVDFFLRVSGPSLKIVKMSALEAEIVKYTENAWGAMKVTFANEIYEICEAFGADFQTVREGWVADGRVERMHTMVIADKRGYKSKCFDKDIPALIRSAENVGYDPKLLKQVVDSNRNFLSKN